MNMDGCIGVFGGMLLKGLIGGCRCLFTVCRTDGSSKTMIAMVEERSERELVFRCFARRFQTLTILMLTLTI